MITALDQPSDIDRAVDAGTNEFLTKPINKAELLLRVRALLKSRQNQREPRSGLGVHRGRRARQQISQFIQSDRRCRASTLRAVAGNASDLWIASLNG